MSSVAYVPKVLRLTARVAASATLGSGASDSQPQSGCVRSFSGHNRVAVL